MRKFVRIEEFRHHDRVTAVAKHSDFHSSNITILGERIELRAQFSAGRVVNSFDALGVLHGERGDRGDAVAAVGGESFQVRGGAGAARRIETCNA